MRKLASHERMTGGGRPLSTLFAGSVAFSMLSIAGCASVNGSEPPAGTPPSAAATAGTTSSKADPVGPLPPALASAKDRPISGEGARSSADGTTATTPNSPADSGATAVAGVSAAGAAPSFFAERRASESLDQLSGTLDIRHEKRGSVITLSCDKLMAPGQWELNSGGQAALDNLGRGLRDQEGHRILIQGYTDSRGSSAINDMISLRRAEAVRDYLIARGVPKEQIRAEGLGSRRPVASNETADDRGKNRRIEIVIEP